MEPIVVSIDIESYSEVDLSKVGLFQYAADPSTKIELVSWAIGAGDVRTWDINDDELWPVDLLDLLDNPEVQFNAFNAQFERIMFRECWSAYTNLDQWHCTMIHAWSLGFSGGLGDVGKQMGMNPDKQKLAHGRQLVMKFCKPAPANHKADRYNKANCPQEWSEYREYNRQDVVAEREMKGLLKPYPITNAEREMYLLDQVINERGLPIDTNLVDMAVKINAEEKLLLKKRMNALTGLENANSVQQLHPWLSARHCNLPNMQKVTLESYLKRQHLDPLVREVLELRQQVSQTSTTKYSVVQRCTANNILQGVFQFGGAQRTQRWAGRMFQPHNLKRGYKDADVRAEALLTGSRDFIQLMYGNVLSYLSNIMRTVVTAPDASSLAVSDYGSIESRVLGYVSGCYRINNLFASGKDSYRDFATEVYHIGYDEVTGEQRFFCKPPVLGCGYQLGGKGLVKYAEGMGVQMTVKEAHRLVGLWRSLYPEVVDMWEWLVSAFKSVTNDGGTISGYCVTIRRDNNFLFVDLPSGRSIAYFHPLVQPMVPPWEKEKQDLEATMGREYTPKRIPTMTYMGRNQYNSQWERISTHGGKITENIVQAMARDILCDGMLKMDEREIDIRGHVHDEVIAVADANMAESTLEQMHATMCTSPWWAPSLLLDAEGFTTKRYRKG